ncbi:hypothetical protein [Burkholderia stabilis]|uniref:hypothetical protein n=1 Tax=Burkholderia stabilis TaxID=95485 RepID=UPI001592928B|nr:hypothetical protein [Burkholderia stabilis]
MTQNPQTVTVERSPQQVADDLFRIGENPNLPAWQYPVLQQAIALLTSHSDDLAVDQFAAEMKSKLAAARAKGRGGWEQCTPADLSRMLREHVDKGDPRDVANFSMFLWHLGANIEPADCITYASSQATACAGCGQHKHTPLRIDRMGGYVCLTCIDRELERSLDLADDQRAAVEFALGVCAGHVAGERHVLALESLLSNSREAR